MKLLRLLLRVLLAIAVLLALAALLVLGPLRERSTDIVRRRVEAALSAALHTPVAIGALQISVIPPRIDAEGVLIGRDGALARSTHVTVRLLARASLRELRPIADAAVADVFVDVPRWLEVLERRALEPKPAKPAPLPPFWLRYVKVSRAQVRLSDEAEPLEVHTDEVIGELEADLLGLLRFAIDAQSSTLSRRGESLPLERVWGRGGETIDGWRLTDVEIVGDGIELAGSAPSKDRLPIRGHVALPRLAFASDVFKRLGGDAQFEAALVGALNEPAVAGDVRVSDFTADGERVGDVSASLQWNRQKLTVATARLEDAPGTAEASGELAMHAPFAYRAQLRWEGLDGQRLARLPERTLKPFTASGSADVSGQLEPLAVQAQGSGRFAAAPEAEAIEWQGRGSYRDGAGGGEIEARQAASNTLRARLDIAANRALNGSFDAAVSNPNALGAFLPIEGVPSLTGALTASAQVSGTLDDPHLDGRLDGRSVVLLGVGINKVGGAFSLDRAALRTPGITAELWQGSVVLSGTLALVATAENDWTLRAVDVPGDAVVGVTFALTGSVPPIGRGALTAGVTARGPWQRVQFSGNAEMVNFWLGRQWIVRAAVGGSALWPEWQLSGELRNRAEQTVTVRGRGGGVDDVAIEAHSSGWKLTALQRGEFTETGGTLMLDASLSGPLRALNGRALLQMRDLVAGGRELGAVDVEAVATRGRWQMNAVLLGGALQVRGSLTPEPGWPVTLEGGWTEADFGSLLVPDGDVHVTSSGTLRASLRLDAPAEFDASVQVPALRMANGPYELVLVQPAALECKRGTCTLREFQLRGANTDLRVAGVLGVAGVASIRVNGEGNLRLLELTGVVESARGGFTVDAEVHRAGGRWDVTGELRVEQAALDVGAPIAITRANGRLVLAGTSVRIAEFGGRLGTGTFTVAGDLNLVHGPDLVWTLTDVGADLLPSLEAEFSGRGGLAGTWQHVRLSGDIEVARMLYDRDIEISDFLPQLNRALAEVPRTEGRERIELELHIVAPGELYVENNVARIEARADLRVSGTAARPILDGRVEALDGTVTFRDRTFELQGGTIDFRPDLGLAAALNITAESTIDTPDATYIIDVRITGTTHEPRVTMTSDDPSLSQTDLATLIAVGKTTAQLRESGGGFSIYDALAAGAGPLARPVTQGTKQILPIDRISFESTYSRTTGTFEPQLKLGKDLTDNLAVSVGQTFGVESRTTVGADYRLTQHVFLTLTWESQTSTQEGAFGAGAKVRYEFWRATPYTLIRGLR